MGDVKIRGLVSKVFLGVVYEFRIHLARDWLMLGFADNNTWSIMWTQSQ